MAKISRQLQSAQTQAALAFDNRQGARGVQLVHLLGAEVGLGHFHAVADQVLAADPPGGLLVDVRRFLEQVGIDAGDPVGAREVKRRLLVVAADADEDELLAVASRRSASPSRLMLHSTFVVQSIYGAIQEYGGFDEPAWLG